MALSKSDRRKLRARLVEVRGEAEAKLKERRAALAQAATERYDAGDPLEGVQQESELSASAAATSAASLTLRRVAEALVRMDAGTYGICTGCGGPIAVNRLLALPFASRCITCQESLE